MKSVYEQVLGADYAQLPAAVQAFHRLQGRQELHGHVRTAPPATRMARLLARCLGTPLRATEGDIRFTLEASPSQEAWTRQFPSQEMSSVLQCNGRSLEERLGLARLTFNLRVDEEGRLAMELVKLKFLGIPCPRWLMPTVIAREAGEVQELHFEVSAHVRGIGQVAGYHGFLVLPTK